MRVVAQFNPTKQPIFTLTSTLVPSGSFNAQFGSGRGIIVVYNKSFMDLLLTFSDGDTFLVSAGQADLIDKDQPKWIVNWQALNTGGLGSGYLSNVLGPVQIAGQQVTVLAYQPSEIIHETFPANIPILPPFSINQLNLSGQLFSLTNTQTVSAIGNFPVAVFYTVAQMNLANIGVIFYNLFVVADANAPITCKAFIVTTNPAYTTNILASVVPLNIQSPNSSNALITEQHTTHAEPTGGAQFQKTANVNQEVDLLNGIPFIIPPNFVTNVGTGAGIALFVQNSAATAMDYAMRIVWGEFLNL